MGWIHIPSLTRKCENFIRGNPELKLSKFVNRKGSFVFYRKYKNIYSKMEYESAEFRLCLVKDKEGNEGWGVDYMRHTGKWRNLPIFGDFDYCLKEIKNGKWAVLMPLK